MRKANLLKGEVDENHCGGKRKGERRIKKVKRESLIHKHEWVDHSQRFSNGMVYINGIEGFWSYAKERLFKYRRLGKDNFGYSLKQPQGESG
jgi:hypothetical protein